MAHQFRPVDRDSEMLLPHDMLDWVPEGHAVRVVIDAVERLMTRDLTGRLVPPSPKGPAAGPQRYDPVMLLTVWMYAYLRGVLSTRAVKPQPQRNPTDPDSRLMPVRGGGFIQGYNCQDAAADDRLMLGGYACQDTGDARQAQELAKVAQKGAAVVAAAHAAHAADRVMLRQCHDRMCTLPEKEKNAPGHDAAACHHAMTSGIGVLVEDAGYHSQANLEAPGPDRLIADGKTRDLARRQPAEGPPPEDATAVETNAWRLRTPEGRALYKRRAPDVEGLHSSIEDRTGLRRFSLRGLHNATSEFLFAGLAHNLRLLAAVS